MAGGDTAEFPLSLHQTENIPFDFAAATNVPVFAAQFGSGLQPDRLAHAFTSVIDRHQALRFRLTKDSHGLAQRISAAAPVSIGDSIRVSADDAGITADFEEILSRKVDLTADGPTVTRIVRLADGGYAALFAVNHTAADGWSAGVLNRDISALYLAAPDDPLPAVAGDYYTSYISEVRAHGKSLSTRQEDFFRSLLRDIPVIPVTREFPKTHAPAYRRVQGTLPPRDAHAVFELARALRTTPAKILMAASLVALRIYFGQDTFGVLDVSAGRARAQADWVGLFSKRVPQPVRAPLDMAAGDFIANVHRHSVGALRMLGGAYSLKRVLTLLDRGGTSEMASALYRRFWTDDPITTHSAMFNCLTPLPPSPAPFGADAGYRPLFPNAPLASAKERISDLDVLPVIQGSSIGIAVEAHPAIHAQTDAEFVRTCLERVLLDWVRAADLDKPIGRYLDLA